MTLLPVDGGGALAVTDYLTKARDWLATCVELTGPDQIARAKAEIATAAEATKQLGLSKEIQLDAQEMVRRAEYALGKAIRKGQAEGTVGTRGRVPFDRSQVEIKSPSDFGGSGEIYGNGRNPGALDLADDFASASDFDAALDEAKAEGNLSRANVARKARDICGKPTPAPAGTEERAHQEAEVINALASMVRTSLTPKNVATLSPKARHRIVAILEKAIQTLKEADQ